MKTDEQRLSDEEMIDILEDLARNSGSATARIQAIKVLREIRENESGQVPVGSFARLYDVSNPGLVRTKKAG